MYPFISAFWIFIAAGLILSYDKIGFAIFLCVFAALLINCICADVIPDLSCSLIAQVSHPGNKAGNAKMLCIYSLVCFWTSEAFKVLLTIPVIWINLDILTATFFHSRMK
jgi:hypothetical protein